MSIKRTPLNEHTADSLLKADAALGRIIDSELPPDVRAILLASRHAIKDELDTRPKPIPDHGPILYAETGDWRITKIEEEEKTDAP